MTIGGFGTMFLFGLMMAAAAAAAAAVTSGVCAMSPPKLSLLMPGQSTLPRICVSCVLSCGRARSVPFDRFVCVKGSICNTAGRYAGVFVDPSTARLALESDVDAIVLEQRQQNERSGTSNADHDNEPFFSRPLVIPFPFAWDFNAAVEPPSQVARHPLHLASPSCAFAWDLSCDVSSPLPFHRGYRADAPANGPKESWKEGSWSETMNALLVRHLHLPTAHCSVSSK